MTTELMFHTFIETRYFKKGRWSSLKVERSVDVVIGNKKMDEI
jgi:hypothetical protein